MIYKQRFQRVDPSHRNPPMEVQPAGAMMLWPASQSVRPQVSKAGTARANPVVTIL